MLTIDQCLRVCEANSRTSFITVDFSRKLEMSAVRNQVQNSEKRGVCVRADRTGSLVNCGDGGGPISRVVRVADQGENFLEFAVLRFDGIRYFLTFLHLGLLAKIRR